MHWGLWIEIWICHSTLPNYVKSSFILDIIENDRISRYDRHVISWNTHWWLLSNTLKTSVWTSLSNDNVSSSLLFLFSLSPPPMTHHFLLRHSQHSARTTSLKKCFQKIFVRSLFCFFYSQSIFCKVHFLQIRKKNFFSNEIFPLGQNLTNTNDTTSAVQCNSFSVSQNFVCLFKFVLI